MRPKTAELRLERIDLKPERADSMSDLKPKRPDRGGQDRQTPCVLQDLVPFEVVVQTANLSVS